MATIRTLFGTRGRAAGAHREVPPKPDAYLVARRLVNAMTLAGGGRGIEAYADRPSTEVAKSAHEWKTMDTMTRYALIRYLDQMRGIPGTPA